MKKNILLFAFMLGTGFGKPLLAQNPIIGIPGISDPHVRVFNKKIYLYSGHDDKPDDSTWVMKDWRVFSTSDLVNWKLETIISPQDNYMDGQSTDCWAGDAASRNGKYYFYFSDGKRGIGVMKSDAPGGKFTDALGKPLVAPMHDPTILADDDRNQTPYLVYGDKSGGGYHIAKLNNDMVSLAEKPKPIVITGQEWEKAPMWMDKNYIFKYKDTYYLSWGSAYAISKNIYGPYASVGITGKGYHLGPLAHSSFFWWKGQFYHAWCYYLKPGYKFRATIITYCHFDNEGRIITDTDFLDKHFASGVGQYDASWPKIEAEWFYEKDSLTRKHAIGNGDFELVAMHNGSWVRFANVNMAKSSQVLTARISGLDRASALEIRLDSLNGPIIGELKADTKAKYNTAYQNISCYLKRVKGTRDVYIRVKAQSKKTEISLDWISFH
ncbi:family 43 glycosylhydrolase [Pedobacter sp. ASV12]|uniref:family 43 glycosylhydrolase n=1 Tax=Pedobacter sp. ASV12 TaxID=2795120 RepID=UPI0018ED5917|nr:family 43 glycosylhydrolase [Pedobacter sp. ASV12]